MKFLALFLALCLVGVMAADTVESVLLVTTLNYPDALVANAVTKRAGIPILYTDADALPQETRDALAEIQPKNVYIIGGPVVVQDSIEQELKNMNYSVSRIWGMTQVGTSIEIAKFFWPDGSEKAVLVADNIQAPINKGDFEGVSLAGNLAAALKIPAIITPTDSLPLEITEAFTVLGVKSVYLMGNFTEEIKTELTGANITIEEAKKEQARKLINDKRKESGENVTQAPFVLIAIKDATDAISAPNEGGSGVSFILKSEDDITAAIAAYKEGGYTKAKLTGGNLELKQAAIDKFKAEGIALEVLGKPMYQIAKDIAKNSKEKFVALKNDYKDKVSASSEKQKPVAEKMLNRSSEDVTKAEEILNTAKATSTTLNETADFTVADAELQTLKTMLTEAQTKFAAGDYQATIKVCNQISSKAKTMIYRLRSVAGEAVNAEIMGEEKSVKQMQKMVQARLQVREEFEDLKLKGLYDEKRAKMDTLMKAGKVKDAMREMEGEKQVAKIQYFKKELGVLTTNVMEMKQQVRQLKQELGSTELECCGEGDQTCLDEKKLPLCSADKKCCMGDDFKCVEELKLPLCGVKGVTDFKDKFQKRVKAVVEERREEIKERVAAECCPPEDLECPDITKQPVCGKELVEKIQAKKEQIRERIGDVRMEVKEMRKEVGQEIREGIKEIGQERREMKKEVGQEIREGLKEIKKANETGGDVKGAIKEMRKDVGKEIKEGLKEIGQEKREAGKEIGKEIKEGIKDVAKNLPKGAAPGQKPPANK